MLARRAEVTGATIPLDDLCTTIVLKNRDCLTFRFEVPARVSYTTSEAEEARVDST